MRAWAELIAGGPAPGHAGPVPPPGTRPRLQLVPTPGPTPRRPGHELREQATFFKAIGDETRLEIVTLLAGARDPVRACDIEAHCELTQSTISHHLKVLRQAGWLSSERRGTSVFHTLEPAAITRLESLGNTLRGRAW